MPPYVGSRGAQDQRTIGVAAVVGDGTPSKSNLETNAILGTSMAAVSRPTSKQGTAVRNLAGRSATYQRCTIRHHAPIACNTQSLRFFAILRRGLKNPKLRTALETSHLVNPTDWRVLHPEFSEAYRASEVGPSGKRRSRPSTNGRSSGINRREF